MCSLFFVLFLFLFLFGFFVGGFVRLFGFFVFCFFTGAVPQMFESLNRHRNEKQEDGAGSTPLFRPFYPHPLKELFREVLN